MTAEGIVVGLLAIIIGAAWAFYGMRLFIVLLPIWAAFFGFLVGAELGQDLFNQTFLGTVTSWVIGIVFAVIFAVLSYFWYYAAIVIAVGALGYALGVGFFEWLGFGTGLIAIIVGLVLAVIFAIAAFLLAVPALLVIFVSAVTGAAAVVNGVLIFFGRIKVEDLNSGIVGGLLTDTAIGTILWVVIAVAAILYQFRLVGRTVTSIERTSYKY
jgi:hypothetical protein